MEYFRDEKNRIQAGFALNAGKLLFQYRNTLPQLHPDQRYEATLAVCVLQSLLTNCSELLEAMGRDRRQKDLWDAVIPDVPNRWGLKRSFIKQNTFPCELTYAIFVSHLRNALSHPTSTEKKQNLPSTGYTTINNGSNVITAFLFTDSPWVDRGDLVSRFLSNDATKVEESLKVFKRKNRDDTLRVDRLEGGKFTVFSGDQPYYPVFEAEIPLSSLMEIALELSNYLAQPVQDQWNGKQISQLVA